MTAGIRAAELLQRSKARSNDPTGAWLCSRAGYRNPETEILDDYCAYS